jgi:hypothetical protein
MPASELLRPYEARSEGIEKDLESAEERFASNVLQAKEFQAGRKICVDAINAQRTVMSCRPSQPRCFPSYVLD